MNVFKTRSGFAYLSAVVIIVFLITCSQIAIQLTLSQETGTRNLATLMSLQELRSQRLLRNSLLLLAPNNTTVNPLHIDPASQLKSDLAFEEATNRQLIGDGTPVDIATQIKVLQPDFVLMESAGQKELSDYTAKNTKDMVAQIAVIFVHEQKYLQGVYATYTELTQQADASVRVVQILEISIYVVSLLVVGYEVLGVVLPAERESRRESEGLRLHIKALEEASARAPQSNGGSTIPAPQ